MRSYRANNPTHHRKRFQASYLQIPTKFIAEIHTVLSTLLILSFTIVITVFSLEDDSTGSGTGDNGGYRLGVIVYMSVALVCSAMDLGLAVFLRHAVKMMSSTKCLVWWRSSFTSFVLFCLLTTSFSVLVGTSLLFLAAAPNAIFKPFAFWIVEGFLGEIRRCQSRSKHSRKVSMDLEDEIEDVLDSGPRRDLPPNDNQNDPSKRTAEVFVFGEPDSSVMGEAGDADEYDATEEKANDLTKEKLPSDSNSLKIGRNNDP